MGYTVRVFDTIGDLADDLRYDAVNVDKALSKVVAKDIIEGNKLAQGFAQASSGIHGKNYWKRLTSSMTGLLEGEYGPHGDVVGNAVGAGYRDRPPNLDLERSQDVIGPKFANDVGDVVDHLRTFS